MAHVLNISELQGLEGRYLLASEYGYGINKKLFIKSTVLLDNSILSLFTVENKGVETIETNNLEIAVKEYNKIR